MGTVEPVQPRMRPRVEAQEAEVQIQREVSQSVSQSVSLSFFQYIVLNLVCKYFSVEECDRAQLLEKETCQNQQCATQRYGGYMPFPVERNSWSDRGLQSDGLIQVGPFNNWTRNPKKYPNITNKRTSGLSCKIVK